MKELRVQLTDDDHVAVLTLVAEMETQHDMWLLMKQEKSLSGVERSPLIEKLSAGMQDEFQDLAARLITLATKIRVANE